jgi:hypothetical protein
MALLAVVELVVRLLLELLREAAVRSPKRLVDPRSAPRLEAPELALLLMEAPPISWLPPPELLLLLSEEPEPEEPPDREPPDDPEDPEEPEEPESLEEDPPEEDRPLLLPPPSPPLPRLRPLEENPPPSRRPLSCGTSSEANFSAEMAPFTRRVR